MCSQLGSQRLEFESLDKICALVSARELACCCSQPRSVEFAQNVDISHHFWSKCRQNHQIGHLLAMVFSRETFRVQKGRARSDVWYTFLLVDSTALSESLNSLTSVGFKITVFGGSRGGGMMKGEPESQILVIYQFWSKNSKMKIVPKKSEKC